MYRSVVNVEKSEGQTKEPYSRRCLVMVVEDESCGIRDGLCVCVR